MTQVRILIIGLLLTVPHVSIAASSGPTRSELQGRMGHGEMVEFTVLDLNGCYAALKQIYTMNNENMDLIDCKCPGLQKDRASDLQLTLFE